MFSLCDLLGKEGEKSVSEIQRSDSLPTNIT